MLLFCWNTSLPTRNNNFKGTCTCTPLQTHSTATTKFSWSIHYRNVQHCSYFTAHFYVAKISKRPLEMSLVLFTHEPPTNENLNLRYSSIPYQGALISLWWLKNQYLPSKWLRFRGTYLSTHIIRWLWIPILCFLLNWQTQTLYWFLFGVPLHAKMGDQVSLAVICPQFTFSLNMYSE